MKQLIKKLKMKKLYKKGYESFTITINGKIQFIHFWKGV